MLGYPAMFCLLGLILLDIILKGAVKTYVEAYREPEHKVVP